MDWPEGRSSVIKTELGWKRMYRKWPQAEKITALFPDHSGAAVWIRPDLSRAVLAQSMREQHGWRTISEVDDNYMMDPRLNVFLRKAGWGEDEQSNHMKAICSMNAIVFSTEHLRDMYSQAIRRARRAWAKGNGRGPPIAPELYVCRNHVPEGDWPQRIERDGPIRVGWMGSPSHVWDVDLAWPALLYASQNGAETWMVGYDPVRDPIKEGRGEENLVPRARDKVNAWKKVGYKTIGWRKPAKYERIALPLDIGLCPLRTDAMTCGKSDVKHLEYAINGAATIAQNNVVYGRTIVHGETGLLVGSPSEMIDAVKLLMKDENLRQRLVANAQQYVREQRGSAQMRAEWEAAIRG